MKKTYDFGFILFISCVAALGGFLFGFDSAVINGTVKALAATFKSDALGSGFSVASALLGCAVGAFYAGTLADKVGRRPMMLVAAVLFLVSAWGSGISNSVLQFVIYRLIGGLAIGAASVLAPAYISEVSPAAIRGRLASLQQLAIVLGILAAFFSNYFIAWASGGAMESWLGGYAAWRWMFWAGAIPAGLYLLLILMVPESPRYLVACGKEERAAKVLSRVWGHEGLDAELALIRSTMQRTHKPRLSDLLAKGKLLPIVWIGIGLSVFQQFVGIAVVFYYGAVLWQAAGFSESHALLISILSGTVNIGSTFLAIATIDRVGRKPLLLAGSAGMFVSLGVLAVIFMLAGQAADGSLLLGRTAAISALAAAHLYIFFFAFSWGPVVWVLLGEMFSNRIRGTALAVAASAQWVANFVITMTFPMLLASIGLGGAYGVYTLGALLSFFFVVKWIKETRGKTLEEMSGKSAMNGFERIQAAMRGEQPDRVPVMLHNFMPAAREAGFSQREFGTDPEKAAQAFIQAAEKYDLDGIIMDLDTATIAGALGVPVDFPEDAPARCEKGLLGSLADLGALDAPDVGRNEHLQVWLETMRLLKAYFGNEKYLRGSVDQAPFSMASMLRTPAEWLYDLTDEEMNEPAHRLLEYCTQASCQFIRLMAGAGAHMVATGDSPAGPDMISPAMYREFARPYEDRIAECAHACEMPYLLHICGNTTAILDQFAGRPLDAVELDYKTDVRRAHDLLKDSGVAFWGNIDPSGVLARGTPEAVHRETIRLIEQFADTPRFVLNSGCALPSTVPEENIRAFLAAAGRPA